MKELMGIINLSENEDFIKELTYYRPIATIPFAGRYRIIDFILSNMVNAGIRNVSIFTQGKSRSLMDHLGTGNDWDLDRKRDGLFVLNPVININDIRIHRGDIENLRDHLDYIKYSKQKYVLLTRSYMIGNIDLAKAYEYHVTTEADITVIYKQIERQHETFRECDTLNLDDQQRVISIGRNTLEQGICNISMEMYLMRKELLLEIIQDSIRTGENQYLKQAIIKKIQYLNANAYQFQGYLSCINSIQNYYSASRDILNVKTSKELFHENGVIYTKAKHEASTQYSTSAEITNSLVANGCIIEGMVENSVIGRGVTVGKGAVVKNSIIMQKCIVGENVFLNNVISDKYVHITKNNILSGDPINPFVIKKGLQL